MSEPLARVTQDLEVPRGTDVDLDISVPKGWMGRDVLVLPPRRLSCAHCKGGGCDSCGRAGAITLCEKDEQPNPIRVTLPRTNGREVCIRLPEHGGAPMSEGEVCGHLYLRVRTAEEPSPCVELLREGRTGLDEQRIALMKRSLIMASVLLLTFLALLRLSGWI